MLEIFVVTYLDIRLESLHKNTKKTELIFFIFFEFAYAFG